MNLNLISRLKGAILKTLKNSVIYCNRNGYEYASLSNKKNKFLKDQLKRIGFYKLFTTNNGNLVYVHQIVAFLDQGAAWLKHGYEITQGTYEVHHINSLPFDNRPENLQIVSCADHRAVHEAMTQRYPGRVRSLEPTPINRNGQKVTNPGHFLVNLLQQTMEKTLEAAGLEKINFDSIDALFNIPANIYKKWWGTCFSCNSTKMIKKRIDKAREKFKESGESILKVMRFIIN